MIDNVLYIPFEVKLMCNLRSCFLDTPLKKTSEERRQNVGKTLRDFSVCVRGGGVCWRSKCVSEGKERRRVTWQMDTRGCPGQRACSAVFFWTLGQWQWEALTPSPWGRASKKYNSTSGAPAMASTSPTFHLVHPRMEHSTVDWRNHHQMQLKQKRKDIKNKNGMNVGCYIKLGAAGPLQSGVSKRGLCVQRPLDDNSVGQICLF